MNKGSTIAKYIDKEYNKEKYWKAKRERENNIRKINVSSGKIMILGENARNTLILEENRIVEGLKIKNKKEVI